MSPDGASPPGGSTMLPPVAADRVLGCLLGGAIGDALGAPIEFTMLKDIQAEQGDLGVRDFVDGAWPAGTFTDDTQMTLFTTEGLIRAENRRRTTGQADPAHVLWHAYLGWLHTQGERVPWDEIGPAGWLVKEPVLQAKRAPGTTCLTALSRRAPGSVERPHNNSKGCGGVMRVAPIGLVGADPFQLGVAAAAITHGHPSGYLAAGCFAHLVARVSRGHDLRESAVEAIELALAWPGADETAAALFHALDLASLADTPDPRVVERLGAGWIAEEALAISVYCALVARDFASGVLLAVNHSGDSDSTGAITGNLLGAALGVEALPISWQRRLRGHEVVEGVARDLVQQFAEPATTPLDPNRYPPW